MPEGGSAPTTKQQFWTAQAVLRPQAPRPEFHSAQAWAVTGNSETNFNLDAIVLVFHHRCASRMLRFFVFHPGQLHLICSLCSPNEFDLRRHSMPEGGSAPMRVRGESVTRRCPHAGA